MKTTTLLSIQQWHRRLGVLLSSVVLAWALTGVLHSIINTTQPKPAHKTPPIQTFDLKTAQPLPTILQQRWLRQFKQAVKWKPTPKPTYTRVTLE